MDYEILYKNALERAKKFIEENPLVQNLNTWIKETFPELKEPEDEKVRKALIEMVHDTTGDELWVDYNVHKEEVLAWLEKQGEQKPAIEMKSAEEFQQKRKKQYIISLLIRLNQSAKKAKPKSLMHQLHLKISCMLLYWLVKSLLTQVSENLFWNIRKKS